MVEKSGKEYVYVQQPKDHVKLPFNQETIERLKPHFTSETQFLIKDEKRGRTYRGTQLEWWINMDAETLIKSSIHGRDMRLERC